ncbi:MAG: WecB/TagA/CpsF family glycosyltransferase [Kiritimatiellae bacterium]|nr:WecB/TagA/CpsF family glycosyltransferase [Kiritimatiellia bacterium]
MTPDSQSIVVADPESHPTHTRFRVLTTKISALTLDSAADLIFEWIKTDQRQVAHLCTTDTTVQAYDNPELGSDINTAGFAAPDGMPLAWIGRAKRHPVERIYGPDLMLRVLAQGVAKGTRHFFYGDTPTTLQSLHDRLEERFPGLQIAGTYSPPFRDLDDNETRQIAQTINAAKPDIVWVGLGTPKQDLWVHTFRPLLDASALIPVGAAFRFHAGVLRQAPRWVMRSGLEWLFRLLTEPRRLWRRYLIGIPRFLFLLIRYWRTPPAATRNSHPQPADTAATPNTTAGPAQQGHPTQLTPPAPLDILGVNVHPVSMGMAVETLLHATQTRRKGYVCVTGVHGVVEAQRSHALRDIQNRSFLTVPDGMPTVWIGRGRGYGKMGRVYGPDLMLNLCKASVARGLSHFLYGGQQGVAKSLKKVLEEKCPGIRIVGTHTPPFRELTETEEEELQRKIGELKPDILWVGLGTPKQEFFMASHIDSLDVTLMLGVGAAFDIHTGRLRDAPKWVKRAGLQWSHRLLQEPRRLWKRYLYIIPVFTSQILWAHIRSPWNHKEADER